MDRVVEVRKLYDAMAVGDGEPLVKIFSEDIEWSSAEGNPLAQGIRAFVGADSIMNDLFSKLGVEWDDFQCVPVRAYDAGAVVVVEGRYTAVSKRTGRSLDAQTCHVWTFDEEDKISRFQQYTDTGQWQSVLGVTPGDQA